MMLIDSLVAVVLPLWIWLILALVVVLVALITRFLNRHRFDPPSRD